MSNTVVWELLGTLILQTLDFMGDPAETFKVEKEGENHPLVYYLEHRLSKVLGVQGAARCPELEKRIVELKRRDPTALKKLVEQEVKDYYSRIKYRVGEKAETRLYA
ncbi:MAG: hypothetical protein DRJ37_03580 [Thermoprotei archaeon]|nr:MAG: hypothetical protein DRJ37_03580 [Thermoprotei archaeon]